MKIVECHFEGGRQDRQIVGSTLPGLSDRWIAAAYPRLALDEQWNKSKAAPCIRLSCEMPVRTHGDEINIQTLVSVAIFA